VAGAASRSTSDEPRSPAGARARPRAHGLEPARVRLAALLLPAALGLGAASASGSGSPGAAAPLPGERPAAGRPVTGAPDHECHLFGYVFGAGAGSESWLRALGEDLHQQSRQGRASRDGWGFAYFLSPPLPWIARPIMLRGGAPACEDDSRWEAAIGEIADRGLAGASVVFGHVRNSSSGPDGGALPDPHPFADSLAGRWWLCAHNGATPPDTLLGWLDPAFLEAHPLDYAPLHVDSELLFRYCLQEIAAAGGVRAGLRAALGRIASGHYACNLCLTDGDTLWAAHSFPQVPFYYGPAGNGRAWWASVIPADEGAAAMENDHLYWFAPGGMGAVSYAR